MDKYLKLEERKIIEKYKDSNLSGNEIGKLIGRHKNVVNTEFRRGGGRSQYNAEKAQKDSELIREHGYTLIRKPQTNTLEKKPSFQELERDVLGEFSNQIHEGKKYEHQQSNTPEYIPKLPLKIWIDRYKEEVAPKRKYWNKERRYFEFWMKHLGESIAVDIDPTTIEKYADIVLNKMTKNKTPVSRATRAKYLLYLSSLYTTAIKEWKWAIFNPLSCLDLSQTEKKEKIHEEKNKFEEFYNLKTFMNSIIKKKCQDEKLTVREAAKKCDLSLHSFQYAMIPENNITLLNFMKMCKGFDIKIKIESEK